MATIVDFRTAFMPSMLRALESDASFRRVWSVRDVDRPGSAPDCV